MSHDRLSDFVDATAAELGIPGVAVGVWVDGREVRACRGVTSVENPLPVDPNTLFVLGSVTKAYTAYPKGSPQAAATADLLHKVRDPGCADSDPRNPPASTRRAAAPRSSTTGPTCSRASCPVHRVIMLLGVLLLMAVFPRAWRSRSPPR